MSNQISDVIEKAADLLESGEVGWCQHETVKHSGGQVVAVCAIGALDLASQLLHEIGRVRLAAHYATWAKHRQTLPNWNDRPGRTKEEVIDLLKEVAKDIRNKESGHTADSLIHSLRQLAAEQGSLVGYRGNTE